MYTEGWTVDLDKLKEVLKPLIEGRDDAADIIEQIMAAAPEGGETVDVEAVKAEALKEARAEMNDRYMAAFFGGDKDNEAAGNTATPTKTQSEREAEGAITEPDDRVNLTDLLNVIETTDKEAV